MKGDKMHYITFRFFRVIALLLLLLPDVMFASPLFFNDIHGASISIDGTTTGVAMESGHFACDANLTITSDVPTRSVIVRNKSATVGIKEINVAIPAALNGVSVVGCGGGIVAGGACTLMFTWDALILSGPLEVPISGIDNTGRTINNVILCITTKI
jgi:hypothetical protein